LWPPLREGSAPLYLDQLERPLTIWIAKDGTHQLQQEAATTTTPDGQQGGF
jgi:hypothetical protein